MTATKNEPRAVASDAGRDAMRWVGAKSANSLPRRTDTRQISRDTLDEIRHALAAMGPDRVCELLRLDEGMTRQPRGVKISCPWHAERTPSCSVKLGDDDTLFAHCFGCENDGDVFALVAVGNNLDEKRDFPEVARLAADLAGVSLDEDGRAPTKRTPPPRPAPRPPRTYPLADELAALWQAGAELYTGRSAHDAYEVCEVAVSWLLARKGLVADEIATTGVARLLREPRGGWPRWWPQSWAARRWLGVLAYDAHGVARSIHARALDDLPSDDYPKTHWPSGCPAKGLLFADAHALALLRGDEPDMLPGEIVVCEGLTDFLTYAVCNIEYEGRRGVLGGTSGNFAALAEVTWPAGTVVYIDPDPDGRGDEYAAEILDALVGQEVEVGRVEASAEVASWAA